MKMDRRTFAAGIFSAAAVVSRTGVAGSAEARADHVASASATSALRVLEQRYGGRLGVAAIDTGSRRTIEYRAHERFPMCSTFKFLLCAAALHRIDAHAERLDRRIPYGPADLLEYAPVTRAHVRDGAMTLAALCAAAIEYSDNTAADLILKTVGGPAGVTRFARTLGDPITRLDRTEPALNTALPGDPRDTTSPAAMRELMAKILFGNVLTPGSRAHLEGWLAANKTGAERLRAGFPPNWRIGDKTGTGDHNATNDIAVVRPPGRAPLLVTAYYVGADATPQQRSATLAAVARTITVAFTSNQQLSILSIAATLMPAVIHQRDAAQFRAVPYYYRANLVK